LQLGHRLVDIFVATLIIFRVLIDTFLCLLSGLRLLIRVTLKLLRSRLVVEFLSLVGILAPTIRLLFLLFVGLVLLLRAGVLTFLIAFKVLSKLLLTASLPYILKIRTLLHWGRTLFSFGTPLELDGGCLFLLATPVLEPTTSQRHPKWLRVNLASNLKQLLVLGVISGYLYGGLRLPTRLLHDLSDDTRPIRCVKKT
jgi:hypothetical protein